MLSGNMFRRQSSILENDLSARRRKVTKSSLDDTPEEGHNRANRNRQESSTANGKKVSTSSVSKLNRRVSNEETLNDLSDIALKLSSVRTLETQGKAVKVKRNPSDSLRQMTDSRRDSVDKKTSRPDIDQEGTPPPSGLKSDAEGDFSSSASLTDEKGQRQIRVHHYTQSPEIAWQMLKPRRTVRRVRLMSLDTPVRDDAVRFVCIGCSHGMNIAHDFGDILPPGDVLLIAGDFTTCGLPEEIKHFNDSLSRLPYKHIVVVAGNNELSLDASFLRSDNRNHTAKEVGLKQAINASLAAQRISSAKLLLTNCHYLEDELIELYGIKIYGSPWQPICDNWAFNAPRGTTLLDKWNQIPRGIDVLLTHTPPLGHGDKTESGVHVGDVELLNSICKRIRPAYHVFAKEEFSYGSTSDGYTKFINCALCSANSKLAQRDPVIFDIVSEMKAEHNRTHSPPKEKGNMLQRMFNLK